jgi:hypothetical protein
MSDEQGYPAGCGRCKALREALERLTVDLPAEGRAYKGNETLPDAGTFYKAYNAGITAQFAHSSGIARAALAKHKASK